MVNMDLYSLYSHLESSAQSKLFYWSEEDEDKLDSHAIKNEDGDIEKLFDAFYFKRYGCPPPTPSPSETYPPLDDDVFTTSPIATPFLSENENFDVDIKDIFQYLSDDSSTVYPMQEDFISVCYAQPQPLIWVENKSLVATTEKTSFSSRDNKDILKMNVEKVNKYSKKKKDVKAHLKRTLETVHDGKQTKDLSGSTGGRCRKVRNHPNNCYHLWDFLRDILDDPTCTCVIWINKTEEQFRITNTSQLSSRWGQLKNSTNMTYDKLSRTIRYYCTLNILEKIPGTRLQFRFGKRRTWTKMTKEKS